jgi:8-oxo-dGTP diphosphatase
MVEKEQKQIIIVKGLVTNDAGDILLVRRKREWHKEAHDKWEFPGGKIDFGETPEEAVVREIKEESGYSAKVKGLLPKLLSTVWEFPDRKSQQILICYVCDIIGGEASLGDHGVSEIKWFTKEEALKLECLPGIKEFLKLL